MVVRGDHRARPHDVGGRPARVDGRGGFCSRATCRGSGGIPVFALFGTITPLFALLAQPHRGGRERLAATTAVDIAGIAVMTGFLYSRFMLAADIIGGDEVQLPTLAADRSRSSSRCWSSAA